MDLDYTRKHYPLEYISFLFIFGLYVIVALITCGPLYLYDRIGGEGI